MMDFYVDRYEQEWWFFFLQSECGERVVELKYCRFLSFFFNRTLIKYAHV